MLNLIDDLAVMLQREGVRPAFLRAQQQNAADLAASKQFPNVLLAVIFGGAYAFCLVSAACVTRILSKERPSTTVRRLAQHYAAVPELVLHKAIELQSLSQVQLEGRGLDLGCGEGIVGGELIHMTGLTELHGVDLSRYGGQTAPTYGYASYCTADMARLPYHEHVFDYAVSICTLEHVEDLDGALRESARVLRAGGQFCLTTPAAGYQRSMAIYRLYRLLGLQQRAENFCVARDAYAIHYHCYSRSEWEQRLARLGFTDVHFRPIFSPRQLLVYDLLNIQIYFLRVYFYEHLRRLVTWSRLAKRVLVWAAAEIGSFFAREIATAENATHHCICCRVGPRQL